MFFKTFLTISYSLGVFLSALLNITFYGQSKIHSSKILFFFKGSGCKHFCNGSAQSDFATVDACTNDAHSHCNNIRTCFQSLDRALVEFERKTVFYV